MRSCPVSTRRTAATVLATLVLALAPSAAAWASADDEHAVHGGHATHAPAPSTAGTSPEPEPSAKADTDAVDAVPDVWGEAAHEHDMADMTDDEMAEMDHEAPTHDDHADTATDAVASRPRAAVLGTFAGVNGAVLVAAGLLRRRDRTRPRHRPRRPAAAA